MFKRVVTIGTFDTPHIGHAILINRCRALGETVFVGVNSDAFVQRYKGVKPVYGEDERIDLIRQMGVEAYLNEDAGRQFVVDMKPDAVVIGNDWLGRDYLAQIGMTAREFQEWDLTLVYVPATLGISTTDFRERLGGLWNPSQATRRPRSQ